jgi:hypothetical protein
MHPSMWPSISELLDLPIERQAQYADQVCGQNARNLGFCQGQLAGSREDPQFDRWNATSIGNLAYMTLYGCEETREDYRKLLDRGLTHFRQQAAGTRPDSPSMSGSCMIM